MRLRLSSRLDADAASPPATGKDVILHLSTANNDTFIISLSAI